MSTTWPPKDPEEVLDYTVDWSADLSGDTIATSTFTLPNPAGLTKDSDDKATTSTTIWLSGGTAGLTATIRNTIVTTGGRTLEEDIALAISSGLVVETGAGLAHAEAFASVAAADAYCLAHAVTWSGSRAAKEAALRRTAAWLTNSRTWMGYRTQGRQQALSWPRAGVVDGEGWNIESNEIPVEIVNANIELAAYELANPGGLTPTVTVADRVKSEQIGPIKVEYAAVPATAEANRPVLTIVNDLIAPFLDSGSGSSLVGETVRA